MAAPSLAAHDPLAPRAVLAAHLVALCFLPFAVTGASFHLLPVMLRNDVRRPALLRLALPLLAGGFLAAPGIAFDRHAPLWIGASLVAAGLACVLAELIGLVRRAPGDRTLVVSRTGVSLVVVHVSAALVLGAVVFSHGDDPFGGVVHGRWLLVHLHLAVVGWLTLLIVTVGRTLGPMLAQAPAARPRRLPLTELALTAGLWALLVGIGTSSKAATLGGGALIVVTLVRFAQLLARVARERRGPLEAPLVHLLGGAAFLLQAAAVGAAVVLDAVSPARGLTVYVVLLLVGWACGVTLGHLGKLLALSVWVWWPPGPRPKQGELYPRRAWLVEAAAFAAGVELLAAGALAGSVALTRVGAAVLVAAAAVAGGAAWWTWARGRSLRAAAPG